MDYLSVAQQGGLRTDAKVSFCALLLIFIAFHLQAANLPPGFVEQQLATGLDPSAMAMAPDGRIFIAEKNGRVLIVENDVLLEDPFTFLEVDNFNERGLGGIVFHPDFEQNNYIYFYYSAPGGNYNQVVRLTANGNYAIIDSEEIIFTMEEMAGTIHNGGGMHFGPDGKLYISVGDGADANTANSMNSLLGKVLRINDDGTIPGDNPYYTSNTGVYRAIWASGLRNTFSTAMNPLTGQLFGGDVGSNLFEEVNNIVAGGYYGWPDLEGYRTGQVLPSNYQDPLFAYDHGAGCAVIGAAFYVAETPIFPPQYHDKFFFADYCEGYIKVMNPQTGDIEETFATDVNRPLSLLVAPNGDMYYIERAGMGGGSMQDNTSTTDGSLWRIRYTGSGAPFIAVQPDDLFLPVGEDASFEIRALGEETLTYQWQRDGTAIPGATEAVYTLTDVQLSDNAARFRCLVTNDLGVVESLEAELLVTSNTRPLPTILEPLTTDTYVAGDTLYFSGTADDAEDGPIPAEQYRWFIDFHHDTHTHPALENLTGVTSGSLIIPRIGEVDDNVWYRVYLVVEDNGGLSQSTFVDVFPEKTTFTVQTEPSGLRVNVDGQAATAPANIVSVQGIQRTLAAPLWQVENDVLYRLVGWQDAMDNNQLFSFVAGEVGEITARYEEVPLFIGNGIGLMANFYEGIDEEDLDLIPPVATRIDPVIDFDFAYGSPIEELEDDFFMISWRGEILAPITDEYTFYLTADDGVRLWVNDELIIDQWVPQGTTEARGTIALSGGERYQIRVDYFEEAGYSEVHLEYSSVQLPRVIVPTTQLFPDPLQLTEDTQSGFGYRIWPIPAEETVQLEIGIWAPEQIAWVLYNAAGRRCAYGEAALTTGTNQITVDVDFLPPGLYFFHLEGSRKVRGSIPFIKGQ
ncbi:MAG: PQQ-dependent sugar dehydrogenase [Bacteroidota bacterium]